MSATRFERLLRWYPPRWRARYGDELVALMEDTYGGRRVPLSKRLNICRAALTEHLRELGLVAVDGSPSDRLRSGSLIVLCGWALFVISGSAFAKMTENWIGQTPHGDRRVPLAAYDLVQRAAVVGATLVLVAAAFALTATARFFREGGWAKIRRPVARTLIAVTTTGLVTVGVIVWAHRLAPTDRHADWATYVVAEIWALMVVACITTATLAVISVARYLRLSPLVLRLEGSLAVLLTSAMAVIIGGVLVWSVSIEKDAPQILSGSGAGLFGVPGLPVEIFTGTLMVVGLVSAVGGASRVVSSFRAERSGGAVQSD